MLFNSTVFLAFYIIFFLIFFSIRSLRGQLFIICAGSLYFYSAWSPIHVLLLLAVCFIAYSVQRPDLSRVSPAIQVTGVIGLLFIFKYYDFFTAQLVALGLPIQAAHLALPVGISFYVFQAMSFIIDRHRQKVGQIGLVEVTGYISFFPQLVAGPIVRADVFLPQLQKPRVFNKYMFRSGLILFAIGMFKKVVIADNLGLFVDEVYSNPGGTTAANHILAFYFTHMQVYYDFAGYSDMAIGIARTLGFRFPPNFVKPYSAASIREFWRRWHISLGTWFRDYLYFPLGGNRRGPIRTYINLFTVFLLCGLWHGAAWTYVVWGGLFGVLMAVERMLDYNPKGRWARFWGILFTTHFVSFNAIIFRSPDFPAVLDFLRGISNFGSMLAITAVFTTLKCLFLVLLVIIMEINSRPATFMMLRRKKVLIPVAILYCTLFLLLGNYSETPFVYFQF